MTKNWKSLCGTSWEALCDARFQSHWAAQAVAAVGHQFHEPRPDDGQSNLEWVDELSALVGRPVLGGIRAGLRISDLTLIVMKGDNQIVRDHPLAERTLDDGFRFLFDTLTELSGRSLNGPLSQRDYEMPEHATGVGQPFSQRDDGALENLSHWFGCAHPAISDVASELPGATSVRCWPHHFDIASLIVLDKNADSESARSIGVGMSPGDASYDMPYFYVNPWPRPENVQLPELPGGAMWHNKGWLGAVLVGSAIQSTSPEQRGQSVADFLRAAIEAETTMLAS